MTLIRDKNIEIVVVKYYKVVAYKYVKILQIINISLMKKMALKTRVFLYIIKNISILFLYINV